MWLWLEDELSDITSQFSDLWNTVRVSQPSISIVSLNVNGIRAAYRKGMDQWLAETTPDVLLLQEVRAEDAITQGLLGEDYQTVVAPSQIKGRAGVAIAVRRTSNHIALDPNGTCTVGLQEEETPLDSGRWIEVDLLTSAGASIRVVSAYFHSGDAKNAVKQAAKMAHLDQIDRRMQELHSGSQHGPQALVAGDFNVVRGASDVKNWKGNHNKTSGVLDEEIAYLNRWVERGWADVVRDLAGDVPGPYSWWSMRGRAFDNDTGWRIDYHFATPALRAQAHDFQIHKAPSWDTRFSDHAPVVIKLKV